MLQGFHENKWTSQLHHCPNQSIWSHPVKASNSNRRPFLQIRKVRHREVTRLAPNHREVAQGHTISK